tara:strand:+ start:257 stop:919 length:663 start_codon:yes stop_codon:yes gene_type:complete
MEKKEIVKILQSVTGVKSVKIEYPPRTLSNNPVSFILEMSSGAIYRFNKYLFGMCPIYAMTKVKEGPKWTNSGSEEFENHKKEKLAAIKLQSIYHDIYGSKRNPYRKKMLLDSLAFIHWSKNKEMEKQINQLRKEAKNGTFANLSSGAVEEYLSLFYPDLKFRRLHQAFAYLINPDDIWPNEKELNQAVSEEAEMQASKLNIYGKSGIETYYQNNRKSYD